MTAFSDWRAQVRSAYATWKRDVATAWGKVLDELPWNAEGRLIIPTKLAADRDQPDYKARTRAEGQAIIFLLLSGAAAVISITTSFALALQDAELEKGHVLALLALAAFMILFPAGTSALVRYRRGVWKPRSPQ